MFLYLAKGVYSLMLKEDPETTAVNNGLKSSTSKIPALLAPINP